MRPLPVPLMTSTPHTDRPSPLTKLFPTRYLIREGGHQVGVSIHFDGLEIDNSERPSRQPKITQHTRGRAPDPSASFDL